MDNNNQPLADDTQTNTQTQASDQPPGFIPNSEPVTPPAKKSKKLLPLLAVLMIAAVAGAVFFYVSTRQESVQTNNDQTERPQLSASTLPKQQNAQFNTENFTTGYVKYDAAVLKKVDTTLPELDPVLPASSDSNDRQVLFMQDQASNPKALYMYDFADKTTYLISESAGAGSYHSPAIMSDHFVVFAETTYSDPLNSTTKIRFFNLQTGKIEDMTDQKSKDFPVSLCCSVSPDGLRLVLPELDQFQVYQVNANGLESAQFPAQVAVFPEVKDEDSDDDYSASQRNYGYPEVVWLDDNRFMYAKSHPVRWTVDGTGSHVHQTTNGLAIMDLTTGRSQDVARTNDASIKWFTVDGNALIYSNLHSDLEGLTVYKIDDFTDSNSQPLPLATANDYQSIMVYDAVGKKLYIQPSGAYTEHDRTVMQQLDVTTGTVENKKIGRFRNPSLEGIIGPNQLIVNIGLANVNDYNIYDVVNNTSEQIIKFE